MPTILVPLAEGFEEIEAITIIDILRRAEFEVVTASLGDTSVKAAHGIAVVADCTLDEALKRDYDMVVLPGGLPGADNLDEDTRIHEILKKTAESGKFIGAICWPTPSSWKAKRPPAIPASSTRWTCPTPPTPAARSKKTARCSRPADPARPWISPSPSSKP